MATIEIDQSGKWEEGKPTVIGIAIGKLSYSTLISAQDKNVANRMVGGLWKGSKKSKTSMIIRMFAYTVFLSIRPLYREGDRIIIDEEYEGKENSIRGHTCLFVQEKSWD